MGSPYCHDGWSQKNDQVCFTDAFGSLETSFKTDFLYIFPNPAIFSRQNISDEWNKATFKTKVLNLV